MSVDVSNSAFPGLLARSVFASPVVGTLSPAPPITSHLWQEYHRDAPTSVYGGPDAADRRVVEHPDLSSLIHRLRPKQRMHLCFLERAVATIDAAVNSMTPLYLCWWIEDPFGAVVREHPTFTRAAYNSSSASAMLFSGRQGWMWDGRNNAANPVFVPAGRYLSRVEVKDAAGHIAQIDDQSIELEGDPYRIWVVGEPKSDADMRRELERAEHGRRFLNRSGERVARDCWIMVHRGERSDGHTVYLGHGTIEATKIEAGARNGAIATPHGREYKGWIRSNPHGRPADADRVQIEDVGRTDETIRLLNPGGPAANNPYSDSAPNTPVKDGVQGHGGRIDWTTTGLSIGCTTASAVHGASVMAPGAVRGPVRSINSAFGTWGDGSATENVAVRGPEFVNKQTKRSRLDDARTADDHAAPLLDPPQHPAPVAGHPDEPLHMQPTMQRGIFGGYQGHEIPRSQTVADAPVNQLRIRMILANYAAGSLYRLYHHAVVFGHTRERQGTGWRLSAWIPNKVIRGWNGNFRNLLVRGRCQIAWFIMRRWPHPLDPLNEMREIMHGLQPTGVTGAFGPLPNDFVGNAQRTWNPALPLAPGEYYSVFDYKVELRPFRAGNDVWVPETAVMDSFPVPPGSAATGGARLWDESLVTNGGRQFIEGRSELFIMRAP